MPIRKLKSLVLDWSRAPEIGDHIPDPFWIEALRDYPRIDHRELSYDKTTGNLRLDKVGLEFNKSQAYLLYDYQSTITRKKELIENCKGSFAKDADGTLIVTMDVASMRIETLSEYGVIWDIFSEQVYRISPPGPIVVWDVGMNVGAASLYFATYEDVKQVIAYEPFPQTYDAALKNFALNPRLSAKIRPNNVGLGASDFGMSVLYNHDLRGGNSTTRLAKRRTEEDVATQISIQNVNTAFATVKDGAGGLPIVCKLDAEGAEYDILPALAQSGALREIDALMIEYHDGARPLVDHLTPAGYNIVNVLLPTAGFGYILASKGACADVFKNHF